MTLLNHTILAVDDDVDDIQLLQEALEDNSSDAAFVAVQGADPFFNHLFGYSISTEQIADAIPLIVPDLILLDLNMPKLSGLDLLQLVRQNPYLCDCKIVMLTTSVNPIDERSCLSAGADLYLVKPSSFAELVDLCSVLLQQVLPVPRAAVAEVFHAR